MYEILNRTEENIIALRVSGKLTASDFKTLRPYLEEKARQHGSLRVLFLMEDWHGWESFAALWEDLKTDVRLNEYVERLAMVGEEDWERWMTTLSKPFAKGQLRYFDRSQIDEAWAWISEELPFAAR